MLRRSLAAFAALLTGAVLALIGATSAQADYVYCDPATRICYTVIEQPAVDPPHNPDPETGFTPGASLCLYEKPGVGNIEIPCTNGPGTYWSNNRQCYVSVSEVQSPPPPGGDPGGAWYNCDPYTGPGACDPATEICRDPWGVTFWSNTPPPGITTLTPQQAAWRLVQSFQIRGIDIGFAPDPGVPGSRSYVGVPIWMWVDEPQPLTFGPYTETATLGGVTITATARVTSILWNMGDGRTVACAGAGTEFLVQYGAVDSPTCGHRYAQTSKDQPGGRYTVTATSQWQVTWNGGGVSGTIPLTAQSQTTVQINELQSVNVLPEG